MLKFADIVTGYNGKQFVDWQLFNQDVPFKADLLIGKDIERLLHQNVDGALYLGVHLMHLQHWVDEVLADMRGMAIEVATKAGVPQDTVAFYVLWEIFVRNLLEGAALPTKPYWRGWTKRTLPLPEYRAQDWYEDFVADYNAIRTTNAQFTALAQDVADNWYRLAVSRAVSVIRTEWRDVDEGRRDRIAALAGVQSKGAYTRAHAAQVKRRFTLTYGPAYQKRTVEVDEARGVRVVRTWRTVR